MVTHLPPANNSLVKKRFSPNILALHVQWQRCSTALCHTPLLFLISLCEQSIKLHRVTLALPEQHLRTQEKLLCQENRIEAHTRVKKCILSLDRLINRKTMREQSTECICNHFTTVQTGYTHCFSFLLYCYTFSEGTLYPSRLVRTSCAICFITVSIINLKQFELLIFVSTLNMLYIQFLYTLLLFKA